ncbi:hypothetical protein [Pseudomonas koreensis]|uniref:hypothetical protein n=1 Tax=Pseudomonas koreensis TaxID=198620 RepID=UPI003F82F6F6
MKKLLLQTTLGLSVYLICTNLYASQFALNRPNISCIEMMVVERWFAINEATTVYGLPGATTHMNAEHVSHGLALSQVLAIQQLERKSGTGFEDVKTTSHILRHQSTCFIDQSRATEWAVHAPCRLASEHEKNLFPTPQQNSNSQISPFSLPHVTPIIPTIPSLHRASADWPAF